MILAVFECFSASFVLMVSQKDLSFWFTTQITKYVHNACFAIIFDDNALYKSLKSIQTENYNIFANKKPEGPIDNNPNCPCSWISSELLGGWHLETEISSSDTYIVIPVLLLVTVPYMVCVFTVDLCRDLSWLRIVTLNNKNF